MTTTAAGATAPGSAGYDVDAVRADFPVLGRKLEGGHPLVYLDSANTSQKPQRVIDTLTEHYAEHNANVARAVHQLAAEPTEAFEGARDKVARLVGAPDRDEVLSTKNVSAGWNLVANVLPHAPAPAR